MAGKKEYTGKALLMIACMILIGAAATVRTPAHAALSAWEDHSMEVMFIALLFLIAGGVIAYLMMNIRMRRRVERKLRNSELNYRTVADFTYDWEYWVGSDGTLRYTSPSCERVTGYRREEFLADPGLRERIVVPEDREIWDAHRREKPEGYDLRFIEFRIRRKDGEVRWIEHTCVPVRDDAGGFMGYRASNRDITDRKAAQDHLDMYREHLERLVRERTAELEAEIDSRRQKEEELDLYRRDLERLVRERTAELEDEITRRKSAQDALAVSEANLRRAQDVAVIGGWNLDLKSGELTWTDGVYRIFGLPPGTRLDYESFLASVHPDDLEYVNKSWSDALKGAPYDIEHRIVVNGAVKWVREKAEGQFDHNGVPLKGSGIVQDITRRKQAQEQQYILRQQLAQVSRVATAGELTAALAHEINQPLAAILANAQAALHILDGKAPDLAELHEILDDIINDNKRAREVISRVRSLLRKEPSKPEEVDINSVIHDAIRLMKQGSDFTGVSVRTELADGLEPVMADRIQVGQVVINLFANAFEAVSELSEPPRNIVVTTRMDVEGEVIVSVEDTGKGIDEGSLRRIFEPFYSTKETGLGLGLSISRSIIEAHGGRLSAFRNPDRGSTFSFSLPAKNKADVV